MPHIDGLRAVAVLLVVFYHLDFGVPGGFIGVDVFFVISGFLIGRIVFAADRPEGFSAAQFLRSRVRRLFPSLASVVILTLLGGFFILEAPAYADLAGSALSASVFVSNFYYWFKFDYFYPQSSFLPLLHTWSLAVEAQFYIAIAILATWPRTRQFFTEYSARAFLIVFVLLFALSVVMSHDRPEAAFFLAPFRGWQFLAGIWIAVVGGRIRIEERFREPLVLFAFGLLIGAGFLIDGDVVYPGFAALAPVAAAAVLIVAGGGEPGLGRRLLLLAPVTYIGRLSYTIYLVHWPLVSLYRNYIQPMRGGAEFTLSTHEGMAVLAATLFVSAALYHSLEARARFQWSWLAVARVSGAALIVICLAGGAILATQGAAWRAGGGFPQYMTEAGERRPCRIEALPGLPAKPNKYGEAYCTVGAPWAEAERRYVLIGDSHAEHLQALFEHAAQGASVSVLFPVNSVVFSDDVHIRRRFRNNPRQSKIDAARNDVMVEFIRANRVDGVFIASLWSGYAATLSAGPGWSGAPPETHLDLTTAGMTLFLDRLGASTLVSLLADIGFPGKSLFACLYAPGGWILRPERPEECGGVDRASAQARLGAAHDRLRALAAERENVRFVDFFDMHCRGGNCPTMFEGRLLYRDTHHFRMNLSEREAEFLARRLEIRELL